jgi:hypothetical protein
VKRDIIPSISSGVAVTQPSESEAGFLSLCAPLDQKSGFLARGIGNRLCPK